MVPFDVDKFFAGAYPVATSAEVTLSEGGTAQFNSQGLSNYFDNPMAIDEIHFQVRTAYSDTLHPAYLNFGGTIRVKLSLGRFALSNVFVPVGCLGTMFWGNTLDSATFASLYSPETVITDFTQFSYTSYFRWKLPRPVVAPVGMPIEAQIIRVPDGISQVFPLANTAVTVNMTYVGRAVKKKLPRAPYTAVPYVGFFGKVFTTPSVATSGQLDLYNPFQSPLTVQRLIGRWQNVFLDSVTPTNSYMGLDVQDTGGQTPIVFPLTQLRTFSGFNITNGFIPGDAVFDANTKSFPAHIILNRGEGFDVTIDSTAGLPATQEAGSAYDGSNTSLVTMIGWRNENVQ